MVDEQRCGVVVHEFSGENFSGSLTCTLEPGHDGNHFNVLMAEKVSATITLIRVWSGKDPLPIPPTGWTEITTFDDGSILCSLVHEGTWQVNHWQPYVVLGAVQT